MWESVEKFVRDLWDDLAEFITDVFVLLATMVLDVVATAIEAIPSPDFLTGYSLASYIPSEVGYFLAVAGFGDGLAIVGAGIVFKFFRRVLTLGIW
jgi:hypothetical protein